MNNSRAFTFAVHVLDVHVPEEVERIAPKVVTNSYAYFHKWWLSIRYADVCTCPEFAGWEPGRFFTLPQDFRKQLIESSGLMLETALKQHNDWLRRWRIEHRKSTFAKLEKTEDASPVEVELSDQLVNTEQPKEDPQLLLLEHALGNDYLSAVVEIDKYLTTTFSLERAQEALIDFVTTWVANKLNFKLDTEQAKAIACTTSRHSRIIARAGSGKTTVMAIRAVFLMEHCHVAPESLLMMAFNKSAQIDLSLRISKYILVARGLVGRESDAKFTPSHIQNLIAQNEIELPWIATFDAASRAIVIAENRALRNQSLLEQTDQLRLIDDLTLDLLKEPGNSDLLREVMTAHFIDDWEKLLLYEESSKGSYATDLPRETLLGERVKSFGEKKIADWLFRHQIEYKYEKSLWLENKRYSPDFTISYKEKTFLIEYLGMAGEPLYDQITELKKSDYSANGLEVIYIYKNQISDGSFADFLKTNIEKIFGLLNLQPLSNDALWVKIREISESRFRTAVVGFVGQLRRSNKPVSYWRHLLDETLVPGTAEYGFSELALEIADRYDQKLRSMNAQDFVGRMIQAIKLLDSNQKVALERGRLRELENIHFICMDEYQDFSSLFEEFVDKLTQTCNFPVIFAVGDGWQSINSHMGANPAIFERFERTWPNAEKLYLTTNYRSERLIVEAGNLVMGSQDGPGATASRNAEGTRVILDSSNLDLKPWEREQFEGDEKTAGIVRLIHTHLRSQPNDSVVLLSRTNSIPWWFPGKSSFRTNLEHYLDLVISHLPPHQKANVSISTVHKYKGLESDVVILIDALDVSFPLIHNDSRFMALFGVEVSEIVEEERRLFYVAVTRAKSSLYIITRQNHESRFLKDLPKHRSDWNQFQSLQVSGVRIICKGDKSHQMKEIFKAAGFRWDAVQRNWSLPISSWATRKSANEIITSIAASKSPWIQSCRDLELEVSVSINGNLVSIPT